MEKNIPDIKQALIYSECDLLDPAQKLKLYMDKRLGGISPKNFKMTGEVSAQLWVEDWLRRPSRRQGESERGKRAGEGEVGGGSGMEGMELEGEGGRLGGPC